MPSLVFLWVCPDRGTEALKRQPKQARTIFCERLQRLLLSMCGNSQQRESFEEASLHLLGKARKERRKNPAQLRLKTLRKKHRRHKSEIWKARSLLSWPSYLSHLSVTSVRRAVVPQVAGFPPVPGSRVAVQSLCQILWGAWAPSAARNAYAPQALAYLKQSWQQCVPRLSRES